MTLGRYVLDEHAASGGMGVVFRARQLGAHGFERTVAVKTIHPSLVAEHSNRHRLIDEARIAAAIHHDNVVEVLDVQDEDGLLFLVLEWIDGLSVRTLLRRQEARKEKLPPAIAVRIVADMLDGLHHAHELTDAEGRPRDLVHRDVSPDNAIIARNGTTKLIDFGLARVRDRLASVTESGAVMGKVSYMAPEQARGEKVDRRADLWAVGVVLRLCITGELAHGATSDIQRLYMLSVGQEPDPLPPETPPFLGPILERALAVDRESRFTSAAEFRAALVAATPIASREEVAALLADPLREREAVRVATPGSISESSPTVTSAPQPVEEASLGAVSQTKPAPAGRRSSLLIAVGAAVVASALTVAFVRSPPKPPAAAAEQPSVAPAPKPAPTEAESVRVVIAPSASVVLPRSTAPRPRAGGGAKPGPSARDYGF
jgi:serine/threonine-protein kinase